MGRDFFVKIHSGYEKCEKLDLMKNRFIRIDANHEKDAIFAEIQKHIQVLLS